jgi:hypothetical protein
MSNMNNELDLLALLLQFLRLAGTEKGISTGFPWIDDIPIAQIPLVNRKYRAVPRAVFVGATKRLLIRPAQQGA